MTSDDSSSQLEARLPARDVAAPSTEQDLDKKLVKANVLAGLFQNIVEPTRIGRFSLIKSIGAGGMGEVYAAYDEQLDRKVAIKLVRAGSGQDASQRLLREAQVLARLSHPNVVQVYEAGTVGDRVFLAMEFIRGQTLREWLAETDDLPEAQRRRDVLAMFLAAGRGLEAAHAAGLVHRDFKPDNVLIGEDGRVCVADFGLARAENPAQGEEAPDRITSRLWDDLTRTGVRMGTPAYMSPEQWRGQPSDSRSDQFSFCVALYEALYRTHPFADERRDLHRERVMAGQCGKPPEAAAVPARIWTVLSRGLAAAPQDRYPDMGTLLADLAADPGRRWRRTMAAALFLGLGALAGGGLALHAASPSAKDPCALAGASVTATWTAAIAAQTRDAFVATGVPYAQAQWQILEPRMDAYAAALQAARKASCEATYVRHEQSEEIFDLESLCLDRRERRLHALRVQLAEADASTVERSAEVLASLPSIAACSDGEELMLGVQAPAEAERAQVRGIQDELSRARTEQLTGHHQAALELASAQLQAIEALAYEPVRAEALHLVGVLWSEGDAGNQAACAGALRLLGIQRRGRGADQDVTCAETALNHALDLAESNRHDELVNEIWLDLVRLARQHHTDFARAHEWARRALATSLRMRDPDQQRRQRAATLSLHGALYAQQGDLALAEEYQRDALQLMEDAPDAAPLARADVLQELASTVLSRGRVDEARAAFEEALAIRKAEFGHGHPAIARLGYDMASAVRAAGDFDRARELLEQALAIWTAIYTPANLTMANVHLKLANLEQAAGNLDAAAEHAGLARAIYRRELGASDSRQAYPEATVALIAFRRERFAEALAAYQEALAAHQRAASANPVTTAVLHNNVAETLVHLDRPNEALEHVRKAEALLAQTGKVLPAQAAGPLKSRGLAFLAKGHARAAIPPLEQALELFSPGSGQAGYPQERAEVEWALARALRAAGRGHEERARALAESARRLFQDRGKDGVHTSKAIDAWLAHSP